MYSYEIEEKADGTFSYHIYRMYNGMKLGAGFGNGFKTRAEAEREAERQIKYM